MRSPMQHDRLRSSLAADRAQCHASKRRQLTVETRGSMNRSRTSRLRSGASRAFEILVTILATTAAGCASGGGASTGSGGAAGEGLGQTGGGASGAYGG